MQKTLDAIDSGFELLVAVLFAAILAVALLQVFHRFALNSSLSWSEELQIFGHIWIVFLGIPVAYRRGAHLYIETFCDMLPHGPRAAFNLLIELTWALFAMSLMALGWMVARVAHMQDSPGLEVPMSYPYIGMVVGGAYLMLVAIRRIAIGAWRPSA
jgi:TRAP-type C4-dicarboxylate transport system permease small subunit